MPDLPKRPVIIVVGCDREYIPQLAAYAHILSRDVSLKQLQLPSIEDMLPADLFELKPEIPPMPRSLPPGELRKRQKEQRRRWRKGK